MRWLERIRGRGGETAPAASDANTARMPDIGAARELAAAGRYQDAIALLTAANRKSRQREIDSELLALRSAGFLAGDYETESPPWPTAVADQFGGEGIPEIGVDALNAATIRSGIVHHGSLIVRQMITPEQVDLLRDDIDRVWDAFELAGSGSPEHAGWFEPFDRDTVSDRAKKRAKGAMLTADSPPAMFDLLETFESCGLGAAIREFFGEPPTLLTRKGTLRRMRHDEKTGGWHQDGGFLGESIRSLNIWIALSDCGVDSPGMDIVARRMPGIVKTGSDFAWWATNPEAAKEVSEGYVVRPVFAAGDAIIFDHLCLHRTAGDPSMTKRRYAIETWLMAPSTYNNKGVPILF